MYTEPKVEHRQEHPYMGIRVQVPMSEFGTVIPQTEEELLQWLTQQGIAPAGNPIIRYHVIDMDGLMDIEMGIPVAEPVPGDGRVQAGSLPAGEYASLIYTGLDNGIEGNGKLIDWAEREGIAWDRYDSDRGDGFGSRYETYLTNPDDEPDTSKWDLEVAIRIADK